MNAKRQLAWTLIALAVLSPLAGGPLARAEDAPADPPEPPPAPAKAKPPEATALTQAEKLVKDIFRTEYAKTARKDRLDLAGKLLAGARQTKGDPAGVFVLLREARNLAAGAGDTETALAACDAAEDAFDFEADPWRVAAFQAASEIPMQPDEAALSVERGLPLADALLSAEEFGAAQDLLTAVAALALRTRRPDLQAQLQTKQAEVRVAQAEFQRVQPALAKLRTAPGDPEANLVAGRFYAQRGDWPKALPRLVLCAEAPLRAAAEKDLAQTGQNPDAAGVGDLWWVLAEKETGPCRRAFLSRAGTWYEQALPSLTSLRKMVIEKRIAQAAAAGANAPGTKRLTYKAGLIRAFAVDGAVGGLSVLRFSDDGCHGVFETKSGVHVYDLELGTRVRSVAATPLWIEVSPDLRRLAGVVKGTAPQPDELAIWDLLSGRQQSHFACKAAVTHAAFHFMPDNRVLAAIHDGVVRVIEAGTGKEVLAKLPVPGADAWCFLPDGRHLLAAAFRASKRIIGLVDLTTGKLTRDFVPNTVGFWGPAELHVTRDGRWANNFCSGVVNVWNVASGELAGTLRDRKLANGTAYRPTDAYLAPDGRRVITHQRDGVLRYWNVADSQLVQEYDLKVGRADPVALSPDGRFALAFARGKAQLFGLPQK